MSDLLKKGLNLGLGAAVIGKEKVEKRINKAVNNKEVATHAVKNMMDELQEKGKKKQDTWSDQFRQEFASSIKHLSFVTKEEMDHRLETLEKKLDIILQNMSKNG